MSAGKKDKVSFDWHIMRRIFAYSKPYRALFYTALVITVLLSALAVTRPLLIKKILDDYIAQKNVEMLSIFSAILLSALILEALCQFANTMLTSALGQSIIKDIRSKLFRHILHFRNSYFDTTPVGTLTTRAVTDVEALADVFSQGFIVLMSDMLSLVVFLGAMFWVNWKLTFVVLLTVPMLIMATKFFQRGVKSTFNQVRNAVAALNTFVQEHIQGMQVVQLFNREEEEYKKFEAINEKHKQANVRSIWYYSIFFPILEILSSLSIALVILYSGLIPQTEKVTAGDITFFIMLTGMMFRPMRMMADRINTLQMGMVAAERVFRLMDADEELANEGALKKVLDGKVEFRNTWFAYSGENYILKDVSFSVEAGETIAIVGATGSGKTTIINLLGRYYDLDKGDILFDGISQRRFELGFLRQQIGVVLQDVFLFSDTIRNNISLFNKSITEEEIVEAAKFIGAHRFIMQLPGGYSFNVRERGAMLSAGQRQMIAFLRAYVHRPAILVLDEATSSIDTETEQLIQSATEKITRNRTSFIIAHRLATIQKARRILVMEGGRIVESGSLGELLARDGAFKALYEQQFMAELE